MTKEKADLWKKKLKAGEEVPARQSPGNEVDGGLLRFNPETGHYAFRGKVIGDQDAKKIVMFTYSLILREP